jgi:hypothetical protein
MHLSKNKSLATIGKTWVLEIESDAQTLHLPKQLKDLQNAPRALFVMICISS